ncbi:MAG: hypothetical protein JO145_08430 [Acidobacteriaceae bacterium]|nr:hypothetical protein [Acidobacteriaceae bacterium]
MSSVDTFAGCEVLETPFSHLDGQHSTRAESPWRNCQKPQQFCTQNYGTSQRLDEVQAIANRRILQSAWYSSARRPSYTVIGDDLEPGPISNKAGLTADEIRLASDAAHYTEGLGLPLWYAVVSDQYSDERSIRNLIRSFKSDLARAQQRSGLPACCYVEVLEGRPAVHSNILFPLGGPKAKRLIDGLLRSGKFRSDELHIRKAKGANWFVAYCSKERLTQARFLGGVGKLAKRLRGSHPLGAGGGDRVRLSKALEAQLNDDGIAKPHRHRYAARICQSSATTCAPLSLPAPR